MNPQKTTAGLMVTLLAGFAVIWHLQQKIDLQLGALHQEQDQLMLQSPKLIKLLSLEYAPLMADVYWTRAVQYYGKEHAGANPRYALLWPMLDITTTLDPNLLPAYRFGAMFLSDAPPRGAGEPDKAIELIYRGIRENPEYWRFYEDLGYVYYFDLKDYPKAAKAFEDGSKIPHAQLWMKVMAAKIAEEGESYETSMFLWKQVYETTKDPEVKRNAESHLQLLKVQEDCRQIDGLSAQYEKSYGKKPTRVNDLVRVGLLRGAPVDPLGYAYTIGEDGKAELNLDSPLLERQVMLERKR
jgi:tetratricopeptide (TPR) repeat protein